VAWRGMAWRGAAEGDRIIPIGVEAASSEGMPGGSRGAQAPGEGTWTVGVAVGRRGEASTLQALAMDMALLVMSGCRPHVMAGARRLAGEKSRGCIQGMGQLRGEACMQAGGVGLLHACMDGRARLSRWSRGMVQRVTVWLSGPGNTKTGLSGGG